MKTSRLSVAVVAAGLLALTTACASPSHAADAADLRQDLRDLPGVAEVDLDYTAPVTLDSGKLELRVRMSGSARPAAAVRVVTTAYRAFSTTHRGEEGDLFVSLGDDTLHLRSFEPKAAVGPVGKAAADAVSVLSDGPVEADITTQDVKRSPHVLTAYTVTAPEPGGDSVLTTLERLRREHSEVPAAGWRVQGRGDSSWQLGATRGFPDREEVALFQRLRRGLPAGSAVQLIDELVTVQVPRTVDAATVSRLTERHLALLGGTRMASYDMTSDEGVYAMVSVGDCTFGDGEVGARLRKDLGPSCTEVSSATD